MPIQERDPDDQARPAVAEAQPPAAGAQAPPPDASPPVGQQAVLTALAGVVGLVVSLVAWGFLELIFQAQQAVFTDLPSDMGYHSPPWWWLVGVLAVAGFIVALAIERLPGRGGHVPANGLQVGGGLTEPIELPGIVLAAFATIALGLVLGPEAPLIAIGGGLGVLAVRLARRDAPLQAQSLLAAAGSFAAMSLLFDQPLIAAVILLEALGLDRKRLPLVLVPGLTAAGIGSLVSIGMGSFTGLSTSAYSLGALPLPSFGRPDFVEFAWTVPLAVVVALGVIIIFRIAKRWQHVVTHRLLLLAPASAMIVAGLAVGFSHAAGRSVNEVLFSGQDQLPGLISGASTWSVSAVLLLLGFKGAAWALSLGSFRGGPTFPALFLGAAGGILASRLPGFDLTAGVLVCMGAAFTAALKLPLSAVVVATLLAGKSGFGTAPLIIVGVTVAYLTTVAVAQREAGAKSTAPAPADTANPPAPTPVTAAG